MNSKEPSAKGTVAWCTVITTCALLLLRETLVAPASTETITDTTLAPTAFSYTPYVAPGRTPMSATPACAGLQMLIPLYSYPNWYSPTTYIWDDVATANSQISITAIINPNNGPGGCPLNSDYQRGLSDLRTASVTTLGYVDTDYGNRPFISVTNDIDLYNDYFDIDGIFFDRVASSADKCDYCQELYESPTWP